MLFARSPKGWKQFNYNEIKENRTSGCQVIIKCLVGSRQHRKQSQSEIGSMHDKFCVRQMLSNVQCSAAFCMLSNDEQLSCHFLKMPQYFIN